MRDNIGRELAVGDIVCCIADCVTDSIYNDPDYGKMCYGRILDFGNSDYRHAYTINGVNKNDSYIANIRVIYGISSNYLHRYGHECFKVNAKTK